MTPVESSRELTQTEWQEISRKIPPRGRTPGPRTAPSDLEQKALDRARSGEGGTAITLNDRHQASLRANSLRRKGGAEVRVVTDPEDKNTIIIGPR